VRRLTGAAIALSVAALVMSASVLAATDRKAAGKDWPTVGGDKDNTRYSLLSQINTSNVGKFGGAWFKQLNATTRSPPVIGDGLMYINDTKSIYAESVQ